MERKHGLFIYERREVFALILVGLGLMLFSFTWGLHLGKRYGAHSPGAGGDDHAASGSNSGASDDHGNSAQSRGHGEGHGESHGGAGATKEGSKDAPKEHALVKTAEDELPSRQELTEQSKGVPQASDEALDQALKEEVGATGAHLDQPKQLDLPTQAKQAHGGATRISGKYTLQVGSYPTSAEAEALAAKLLKHQLAVVVHPSEVSGVGKRYRVLLGGFQTKRQAEGVAEGYQAKRWIGNYVVIPNP